MDKDDLYSEMDAAIDEKVESGEMTEDEALALKEKIRQVLFR